MANNSKVDVRNCVAYPFKFGYRFSQDHPFIFGMVMFLLILRICWPALFYFLLSSFPVFFCTTLLLGALLVYGEPNIPEDRAARAKNRTRLKEKKVRETGTGRASASIRTVGHAPLKSAHGKHVDNSEAVSKRNGKSVEISEAVSKREISKGKHAKRSVKFSEAGGFRKENSSSGSEYDEDEYSSPDASVSDVIPMVDELHPLLDSEAPVTTHTSADNSDAPSSMTSLDIESDEDSMEEEAELEEDEEEEEEAQEERDGSNEAVVAWTADDQKNLMDLGSSELERNQRLENLMLKRKAKKFLSFNAEKNLIDFDINDALPNPDDLAHSRFNYQIPSISAPRQNPFDFPFDIDESIGSLPIPGSAPCALHPRRNPFDIPSAQFNESSQARGIMNHQMFSPVPQRETFYRRHESFGVHDPQLDPYLVPHDLPDLHRQASEHSGSGSSSVHESDSNSPVIDQEDHKERLEEFDLDSYYAEAAKKGSQSDVADSVSDDHEDVESDLVVDANAQKLDMTEDKDNDSGSSSSEDGEKSFKNDSISSVPAASDMRSANENLEDTHHVDPVYDSSPTAAEKSDSLLYAGKDSSSNNSVASDEPRGKTELWVAPPSLASVDEIESRSREVTLISEKDVIRAGLTVIHEDFGNPISPVLPERVYSSRLSIQSNEDLALEEDVMILTRASSDSSGSDKPGLSTDVSPVRRNIPEDPLHVNEDVNIQDHDLQQMEESEVSLSGKGDKPGADVVSKSTTSFKIGKIKNIKKLMPVYKYSPKESSAATSEVSPITTNSPEGSRVGKEHESPSSGDEREVGLSGEGDNKVDSDISRSSSSFKIGKIKNIKKFW